MFNVEFRCALHDIKIINVTILNDDSWAGNDAHCKQCEARADYMCQLCVKSSPDDDDEIPF